MSDPGPFRTTHTPGTPALRPALLSALLPALLLPLLPALPPERSPAPEAAPAGTASHCAARASITPVAGSPGEFRIGTARGSTVARWPEPSASRPARAGGIGVPEATIVIFARDVVFDADGDSTGTPIDTVFVPVGTTVRWELTSSIHTVTSGRDSGDPTRGIDFDVLLDAAHPVYERTFTEPGHVDYFCFFHEPGMLGLLIVQSTTGVEERPLPTIARFTRPPAPNPSAGEVRFAVSLARAEPVDLSVFDAAGRRVGEVFSGWLEAGDHPFAWNGRTLDGSRAAGGVYLLRFHGADFDETRKFLVVR